jgi:hypothetical protein
MITRRELLGGASAAALFAQSEARTGSLRRHLQRPLAITMWDFSWLERRWPGAGYEDWDLALDELKARGYDAVRIDCYPHLLAIAPNREWELLPQWNTQDWGAPARCRVRVQPGLNEFIAKCARRGISVGLSTWFRQDIDNMRMKIHTPQALGEVWKRALEEIDPSLYPNILYVDLCNEYPLDVWAPWLRKPTKRNSPEGTRWMRDSIAVVREAFPQFDYTFSFTTEYETWREQDVRFLDFLEPHLWMTHFSDFYKQVGYNYERFDPKGYDNMALKAQALYRSQPQHWKSRLLYGIDLLAEWGRTAGKPLITTECWSVVDYKDGPMLPWNWIFDLCETGVRAAAAKGQWAAIATSNFCGPQFRGMWRPVAWHRQMTDIIHNARLPA